MHADACSGIRTGALSETTLDSRAYRRVRITVHARIYGVLSRCATASFAHTRMWHMHGKVVVRLILSARELPATAVVESMLGSLS